MKAPLPANETARLSALRDYGVLDTPPELAFDDLTHLAAQICQTPTALVTLIDEQRQWFKSLRGFTSTETKRDLAFCAHSILQRDVMVVPDATKDPRFADNALVTGPPHIRFYAGAPLITAAGFTLGTVAVIDYVPRVLSAEQIEELQALSRQAVAQLELRRQLRRQREQAHAALLVSERRYRRLVDSNIIGVMIANTDGRITEANELFLRMVGYTREELEAGRVRWDTMTPPEWRAVDEHILAQLQATGVCAPCEKEYLHKEGRRVPILAAIALIEGAPGDCICVIEDLTARKQAEATRRASEARYRTLFEYAPDGIIIADPGSIYLDANASMCRMLGYSRNELIGLHASDIVVQSEIPHIGPALNAIKANADYNREWQFRRKDGSVFAAEVMATTMPDGNLLGVIRDVTERKRAAAERQQVFERITDAFVALDRNWNYTFVNAKAAQMFGRRAEDLVGRHIWTEFPEGVGQKFHLTYEQAMADQQPAFLEEYYPPYDRWFENRIYPSPEGLTIYFHDITARKQAVTALRESEARFRAIFEQAPVGISEGDVSTGRVLTMNQRYADIVGYTIDELSVLSFRDFTHPDDLQKEQDKYYGKFAKGEINTYSMEKRYVRKDGEIVWVHLTVAGLTKERGKRRIAMAIIDDITARKRSELELRTAEQQLRTLVSRLTTVREEEAKRISRELHDDLGQQLTALNMELADLGTKLPQASPKLRAQLARMHKGVDHTIEVVQKISGELRLGQLDLLGLSAAIEWQLQEFQQRSGVRCTIRSMAKCEGLTDAQSTAVFRILQETLTNIARHAGATRVELDLRTRSGQLMLEVRDNGRGITPAELGDRRAIGLLGMRERAQALGGDITITGEPGRGTMIRVAIPLAVT